MGSGTGVGDVTGITGGVTDIRSCVTARAIIK
jgi:hypothetical protein